MWVMAIGVAYAGKGPLAEGAYLANGHELEIGRKGKTARWDGSESMKLVSPAPGLLVDALGTLTLAVAVVGDQVWVADYVLNGVDLVTYDGGWYQWGPDGCAARNEAAEYRDLPCTTDENGDRWVDGTRLYLRGPGVWTSTSVPASRAPSLADARARAREVFVDETARRSVTSAAGDWWSTAGDHGTFTAEGWSDYTDAPRQAVAPIAPCMVELDGYPSGFWSDGAHLAYGAVAVTVGDVVWACEDGTLTRFVGASCEAFSWNAAAEPDGYGYWSAWPDLCGGTREAPGNFRIVIPPSESTPGVFTQSEYGRVNPYPEITPPPDE